MFNYQFNNSNFEKEFTGPIDTNIQLININLNINLIHINNQLLCDEISEENIQIILNLIKVFETISNNKIKYSSRDISQTLNLLINKIEDLENTVNKTIDFYLHKPLILTTFEGIPIVCSTLIQKHYIDLLENGSITFVTGSAGSGKTFLAVAWAVAELKKNHIKKIIITRPAVEAGEKLGFLPGDLKEKVDPYLIPIYDALNQFLGKETVDKLIEKGTIEIAPLAYMRGRTLDHAVIILDEAQNTTEKQMKMFLTRLGFDSKMIITGDLTQIDLNNNEHSGLLDAVTRLRGINQIGHLHFKKEDCMRHPLVSKILERYGDD